MLKVGDIVSENGRIGKVLNIATKGTADVQFEDMDYPIRRQGHNLQVVRGNPMRLKKVPRTIKETPRRKATGLYVFPQEKSFPIGDLFHARLALIYVLSPSHSDVRELVIQAVQDAYPEYDWAAWWDSKRKGKPDIVSWHEYLDEYRVIGGEVRKLVANPFRKRSEAKMVSNPRRSAPKYTIGKYDASEAQFHAVVQGIYESLVKQEIGVKSTTKFKDRSGVRLDAKFMLPQTKIKELLGRAFAIATRQEQKHGRLQKGTQKATAAGRKRSQERAKDKKHLAENIQDYEITIGLTRKSGMYRIVKKGRKFYIQPHDDAFNPKGYKTEASAKGVLTRYLNRRGGAEELPEMRNPRAKQQKTGWSDRDVESLKRWQRTQALRKPQKSKGSTAEYGRKLSYAEGTGMMERWQQQGLSRAEIQQKVDKIRISSYKGGDAPKGPIVATVITQYVYLPEMMYKGQPYLMYRRAPIASFFTIELFGPKFRFQSPNIRGQVATLLDRKKWRSPQWAGMDGFNLKEDVAYDQMDAEGNVKGKRFKSLQFVSCAYSPGSKLSTRNGFQTDYVMSATDSVIDAYRDWYEEHEEELKKKDPEFVFPDDCLEPVYEMIECGGVDYMSIDPFLHFGVFLRALLSLLEFKEATAGLGRNTEKYIDLNNIIFWLKKQKLLNPVKRAIAEAGLDPNLLTTDVDAKIDIVGQGVVTPEDKKVLAKIEKYIQDLYAPLLAFAKEISNGAEDGTKEKGVADVEAKIKALVEQEKRRWLEGKEDTVAMIRKQYPKDVKKWKDEYNINQRTKTLDLPRKTTEIEARDKKNLRRKREEDRSINIWYGSKENAWLSNLARRPFTYDGKKYVTVEHAYQTLKSGTFDQNTYKKDWKAGSKFIGREADKETNIDLMYELILESFLQNKKQMEQLVKLGDVTFTHKQDKGIWKTKFPELLKEVQEELSNK